MIYLYSGTPGSGKSYHATSDIHFRLKKKKGFNKVIANFVITDNTGNFTYIDNEDFTIKNLMKYARDNHKMGIEGQTLIVVDSSTTINV